MKRFDPLKPWVLYQETSKGGRYFTGKAHPTSPDAWTPDIRKAARCSDEQWGNIKAHCDAYTWGVVTKRERIYG